MNLHEECLLKYLLNPLGIASSTEILKICNSIIEREIKLKYTDASKHATVKI